MRETKSLNSFTQLIRPHFGISEFNIVIRIELCDEYEISKLQKKMSGAVYEGVIVLVKKYEYF